MATGAAVAAAHTHVGLFHASADGVVTWVNPAASALLTVGDRWHVDLPLDPPPDSPRISGSVRHRVVQVDRDGHDHVHSLVLSVAGDTVVGTLVAGSDATVRQQTTLLATVVASTSDVVAIMSTEGELRFLNRAGRQVVGLHGRGAIGHLHATALFGAEGWAALRTTAVPHATT